VSGIRIEDEGCSVGGAGGVNESDDVVVSGGSPLAWRLLGATITVSVVVEASGGFKS
jgi:hypothetical protein